MFQIRRGDERGRADHGWLDSRHTFSFADYRDPDHMGFRDLRVLNEDRVAPGAGFPTHFHRDMEILSFVLEGALRHEDSGGHTSILRPNDVQHMSAGAGVMHSEYNASETEPVHFLQVWILPAADGGQTRYAQRHFPPEERRGRLRVVASPDGREGSLSIGQDASVLATLLADGEQVEHPLAAGRHAWVQVTHGELEASGQRLGAGDGLAVSEEPALILRGIGEAQALVFDLS